MLTYLVPSDVKPLVANHISQCANLSLILSRYIPKEAIEKETVPNAPGRKWHDVWLTERINGQVVQHELVKSQYERWQARIQGVKPLRRRLTSRMIVGLGGKGPLEIGITLDYITGLPVIPGSALKGLTRSYALYALAEQFGVPVVVGVAAPAYHALPGQQGKRPTPLHYLDEWLAAPDIASNGARTRAEVLTDLQRSVQEAEHAGLHAVNSFDPQALEGSEEAGFFRILFGSNAQSGAAVFYEGVVAQIAASGRLFELDVMTVHFKDYYDQANGAGVPGPPPADNGRPAPIQFVAVTKGTLFAFAVAIRSGQAVSALLRREFYRVFGPAVDQASDEELRKVVRDRARAWLQNAVVAFGVGGKTAAGYGAFAGGEPK